MRKTNVISLRCQLSSFLDYVQQGKEVEIQKRNISIARIVPIQIHRKNQTKLGVGKGSVKILKNIVDPAMDDDWDMHQ